MIYYVYLIGSAVSFVLWIVFAVLMSNKEGCLDPSDKETVIKFAAVTLAIAAIWPVVLIMLGLYFLSYLLIKTINFLAK